MLTYIENMRNQMRFDDADLYTIAFRIAASIGYNTNIKLAINNLLDDSVRQQIRELPSAKTYNP